MEKRFWKKKDLLVYGFKVLGLDLNHADTYSYYIKTYSEKNTILIFSSFNNTLLLYTFTNESEYNEFNEGKFAITKIPNEEGKKTANGIFKKYIPYKDITYLMNKYHIQNKKDMIKAIELAEKEINAL